MLARIEFRLHVVARPSSSPLGLSALVATGQEAVRAVANLGVRITALDDEARNNTVKCPTVEESLLGQRQEGLNMFGRHIIPKLKLHLPLGSHHGKLGIAGTIFGCEQQLGGSVTQV